ncbi:laminin subunit alpha-5-like, partial [Saccoglossus kowalevskii]
MAGSKFLVACLIVSTIDIFSGIVNGQVLQPPYFNIATGKNISATSTCGEEVGEELFCKLTGNTATDVIYNSDVNLIQGQICDTCDPKNPLTSHPAYHAIDGTKQWWQSPPLSRGLEYNEVNVTIDFGQQFHVAYVIVKFANSPRPALWVLERSTDYGQTFTPWQYFASTDSDCNTYFGMQSLEAITRDDQVICSTEYSKIVPLENGEIVVSLVNNRPSANNFSYAAVLQEWTKATTVRLRLIRTNTLLSHLLALARQDPTVTRRYYYSIKDVSIGGRCVCNGHADKCDTPVPGGNRFQLQCTCRHNTCGEQCEICCPGFEQKKWRPATVDSANECEPCNCHGHSNECVYDEEIAEKKLSLDIHGNYEGGGVCQRCQHNTQGINCEECKAGYYRPRGVPLDSPEVCQPCDCNFFYSTGSCSAETGQCECRPEYAGLNCDECAVGYYGYPTCRPCDCHRNGTEGGVCEVGGRQCPCKPNYIGLNCDRCSVGYYDFPACLPCDCDHLGSRDYVCSPLDGQCQCRINYGGRACDECKDGYYNYPACQACSCDAFGTAEEICDKDTGACICKEKYGGPRCSNCDVSYYSYPNCYDCDCDTAGSAHDGCRDSGQCPCLPNFSGKKCDMCASAYFKYPECTPCNCHRTGSFSISCDQITGQCNCRSNFQGVTCSECAEGFYNFPACEECKCDPAGVVFVPGEPLAGCGAATQGLCQCKEKVGGRTCNLCDPLYWNLQFSNPVGCEECHCYKPGTVSGIAVCDVVSGQCTCKEYVDGRRCDQCEDGAFDLQTRNVFGCQACGCDLGGARDENCDKSTGQCVCKPRVSGRTCDRPLDVHFFHNLYHIKYEIEDGRAPRNKPVRFAFRESDFPGYSWRGYAVMSAVQPEVLIPVEIRNPSLYRLVFRYVSQNNEPVNGEVTVTPRTQSELAIEQTSSVVFNPGTSPQLVTVSGNGVIMPFVMDPGQWIISVKSPENILLDYLVLLPSAYYEAPLLQVTVNDACKAGSYQEACNEYAFPSVATYPTIEAEHGYYQDSGQRYPTQTFRDRSILQDLNVDAMAQLDEQQPTLGLSLPVPRPGKYVMIIQYFDGGPNAHRLDVSLLDSRTEQDGHSNIYDCQHLCRAVVLDSENKVKEFDIKQSRVTIYLEQEQPYDLAIDSVTLIPVEEWNEDFVNQALECVLRKPSDICVGSPYLTPPGTQKWEVESLAYLPSSSLVHTGVTPNVDDPNTALYTLDGPGGVPSVEMRDILPDNGRYVFVVHYYQPTSVSYDVNFDIRGRPSQSGTFNAKFCPHVSGCRSVVTTHDGDVAFEISPFAPDLVITIPDDKTLWLDYVMAIPEETYSSDVLEPLPIDRAGEFIRECGQNDFYISSETTGFCRDSVFSLTTDYNNGAVKCDCNYAGSTSFSCDPLGGQCPCKPNVIGRTCDRCKTGYYAFPNCIPCGCVTGVCDDNTGACICPPNVGGPNCDQCLPRTFGYDPFIGCEECDCDPKGVLGDLNCDLVNGQCNCLPNVGGRQCDVCKAGYFNHPRCVPCTCDLRGTTSDVCDQRSSACLCKENVEGVRCDKCKVGTFYLEERNPKGCTSCFCFGITQECKSSSRVFDPITTMNDWTATNFADGRVTVRNNVINIQVLGSGDDPAQAIYFVAPKDYRGNKVSSYGGVLEYSITYRNLRNDVSVRPMRRPDVIFSGNNFELVYSAPSQPVAGVTLTVVVDILESSFQHSIGGGQVSREELMMTLADLTKLHIRAQYMTNIQEASLSFVSFDVAMKKKGTKRPAETVEQCRCPANYKGLSCEKCEDGYYRVSSGAYLGVCVQCECNGHSDICDQETGTCLDCQDNTAGPNCGECKTGYVGDATNGTPYDCQICSCPYPTEINNYASTCVLGSGGETLSCECLPGYTGERCTSCAEGYYGDPTIIGGEGCRPCECNNNELVDPSDGGRQCDAFTGQCLRCRPGTAGHNCERCADGYYGDAIVAKDCKECDCDECGTESCHPETGVCLCKLGVTGSRCHKCPRNYYGFNTCNGCQSCECKSGSEYSQCDDDTGQCDCKPGVGGRDCGECLPGYWNYQLNGCERCDCGENLRCHPTTGDCVCLPGAKGPKCDQCEERYVLTEQGCQECDSCVTLLLDEMDVMDYNVSDAIDDLTGVSVGVDAVKRLMKINDTAYELWAKLPGVKNGYSGNLQPILDDISELKDDANDIEARSRKAKKDAKPIAKEAEDTDKRAAEVEDLVNKAARKAR